MFLLSIPILFLKIFVFVKIEINYDNGRVNGKKYNSWFLQNLQQPQNKKSHFSTPISPDSVFPIDGSQN